MAEDEIRKHTKAVYNTLLDKQRDWKHRLKDISVEILIIVFAVTVSIWFHNLSEELQEHREEKDFLVELKKDLQADSINIKSSLQFYEFSLTGIKYFEKVGSGDTLSKDSLHAYGDLFFSSTELQPHVSRYEALKGSGKFNIIEDKQLLNNIIDLHQSVLTRIESLNNYYQQYIQRVATFIEEHALLNQQGDITIGQDLLRLPQFRFLLGYGRGIISGNLISAHVAAIKKCNELSEQIEKALQ